MIEELDVCMVGGHADGCRCHTGEPVKWILGRIPVEPILRPADNELKPLIDAAVHILNYPDPPKPQIPPGTAIQPGIPIVEPILRPDNDNLAYYASGQLEPDYSNVHIVTEPQQPQGEEK